MERSVGSTSTSPTRPVRSVTRRRTPISSHTGGARPDSRHAASIRGTPLPHCSTSPSSWSTRPITRFLSFETPSGRSSTVSPNGNRPGHATDMPGPALQTDEYGAARRIGERHDRTQEPVGRGKIPLELQGLALGRTQYLGEVHYSEVCSEASCSAKLPSPARLREDRIDSDARRRRSRVIRNRAAERRDHSRRNGAAGAVMSLIMR